MIVIFNRIMLQITQKVKMFETVYNHFNGPSVIKSSGKMTLGSASWMDNWIRTRKTFEQHHRCRYCQISLKKIFITFGKNFSYNKEELSKKLNVWLTIASLYDNGISKLMSYLKPSLREFFVLRHFPLCRGIHIELVYTFNVPEAFLYNSEQSINKNSQIAQFQVPSSKFSDTFLHS